MEFPKLLKEKTAEDYRNYDEARSLSEEEKRKKFASTTRIVVKYRDSLRKELRSGNLTWYSDSTKGVGGLGVYPGALQHFLAGLPLCQMSHYAERASVSGLRLESLEVTVDGHFLSLPGHPFDEIVFETKIVSPENAERITELAKAAENDCYVTNTLKRACRVSGKIFLNGQLLFESKNA